MNKENISVIIPCFNEEKNISSNTKKIFQYLKDNFENFEIIAVNDGSTDRTINELQKIQSEIPLKIIDNPINEGKGKAVRDGVLQSRNDIVMFLDADLAIPVEELPKFLAEINGGYDVAIASRFVPGGKIIQKVLWYRVIMEQAFRIIRMLILNNYSIQDTQCGFKVFRREVALKIFPLMTIKRFAFDSEIIFLAVKFGFRIKECPITLQNPIQSHLRIFCDPLNMLLDILKIRWNNFSQKYTVNNDSQ